MNFSFKKKNNNYIIINDFEDTTEQTCIKIDKSNEKKYKKFLGKATKAHATIKNIGLSMNLEVPLPPRPNNRDRYILWNKRNINKPVIEQSDAVIFLYKNGYELNIHYEAYQAIELFKEINTKNGIKNFYKDKSKEFSNIYNKHDKNIFRRRSMYNLNNTSNDLNNSSKNSEEIFSDYNEDNSLSNLIEEKSIITINNNIPSSNNIHPNALPVNNMIYKNKNIYPSAPPFSMDYSDDEDSLGSSF